VNTVFALKYARMYYDGEEGGIDFRQQDPPAHGLCRSGVHRRDVVRGVRNRTRITPIHTVALGYALLAYLFGTVVIAVAINLVSNLATRTATDDPRTASSLGVVRRRQSSSICPGQTPASWVANRHEHP
jgi:hypothetical protein